MNRHPGQSVTYQEIRRFSKPLLYPCPYADIDENAESGEEENSPNNISNNFYNPFIYISNNISSIYLHLNLFIVILRNYSTTKYTIYILQIIIKTKSIYYTPSCICFYTDIIIPISYL